MDPSNPPSLTQGSSRPIYDAAELCFQLFEQLLKKVSTMDKERLAVEDLHGRFQQWAAYLGAFAVPKASLDARLAFHDDIRGMVLELLSMVQLNLRWAWDNHDEAADCAEDAPGLAAVKTAINCLLVQAVAIRRSARRISNMGLGTSDAQAEEACILLLRHRYPKAPRSLCIQLGASICRRGTSLRYLQNHNKKLACRGGRHDGAVPNAEGDPSPPNTANSDPLPGLDPRAGAQGAASSPETLPSRVHPSAIHRFSKPKSKPTSSVSSRGTAARMDDYCYPPLPKPQQAGKTPYSCIICGDPFKSSTLTEKEWRTHVKQDLEPYVCVSEYCSDPIQYFIRKQDWMNHMIQRHTHNWAEKVHTARWYCDVCPGEPQPLEEFEELASFAEHLRTKHSDKLSKSQQLGRARLNRRTATRDPFVCPLCDCVPGGDIQARIDEKPYSLLAEHIAKHLESLAFLSLSHLESEDDGGRDSVSSSLASKKRDQDGLATASTKKGSAEVDGILVDLGETECGQEDCSCHCDADQFRGPPDIDAEGDFWREMTGLYKDSQGAHDRSEVPTAEFLNRWGLQLHNIIDKQKGLVSRPASAITKAPKLYREIRALKKCPNGADANFVPEHSLRDLFRKLREHLRNLETLSGTDRIDELVLFICEQAPKAFATLVMLGQEKLIICLFNNRFDDTLMPVTRNNAGKLCSFPAEARVELADMAMILANEEDSRIKVVDFKTRQMKEDARTRAAAAANRANEARAAAIVATNKIAATFGNWDERTIDRFCDAHQWPFLAPVFDGAQFYNIFAEKAVMPFWPSGYMVKHSPFSSVEKWQVHRAHLPCDVILSGGSGGHPWVAVKILKRDQFTTMDEFKQAVQLEAKVLNVMSSLKHDHLIRTIACYSKGQSECFVFPWADYGNLRDYWENSIMATNPKKRLAHDHLWWVFRQLYGLAHAITQLHGRIIRHGDLKPENILCFRNDADKQSEGSCKLVIADAGLAKIDYQITQLRTKASLGPKGGTLMYEPPEAEVGSGAPMSRRYDVWSMGCICLEFLIWLVDGQHGLKDLAAGLDQVGKFYQPHWSKTQGRTTGAGRQQEVDDRIDWLRAHPFCQGEGNPLGRLVELIDKKLLVHSLGKPIPLQHLSPPNLRVGGGGGAAAAAAPAPPGYRTIARARAETFGDGDVFDVPPGSRVKSDAMLAELSEILNDMESFWLPSSAIDSSAALPFGPGQSRRAWRHFTNRTLS